MEDPAEVDQRFFEREMPSPATQSLFDEGKRLRIGYYIGYGELTQEGGRARHFNTAILVSPDGKIIGKYRKIHLPGHADHKPPAAFQHLEKKYFEVGDLGFRVWRFNRALQNDRRACGRGGHAGERPMTSFIIF